MDAVTRIEADRINAENHYCVFLASGIIDPSNVVELVVIKDYTAVCLLPVNLTAHYCI